MSEPLFNRSKAVADLNRVDGFDPMELARVIQNDGQEPQLYLDVKFRKLWFRLCNPKGKISKKILSLQENMAVVEAKIYLDKDDPEEGYIASALSQKFRTDDPQFGNKFLETAETAATGRALADAGYGIRGKRGKRPESSGRWHPTSTRISREWPGSAYAQYARTNALCEWRRKSWSRGKGKQPERTEYADA